MIDKCELCNFLFDNETKSNLSAHKIMHYEHSFGPKYSSTRESVTIFRRNEIRIDLVKYTSTINQKRRAEKIAKIANDEMHYGFGLYTRNERYDNRDLHHFLLFKNTNLIGLLQAEMRRRIGIFDLVKNELIDSINDNKLYWSFAFIFLIKKYRRNQYASVLMNNAKDYLHVKDIAILTPISESGRKFLLNQDYRTIYICSRT